MNRFEGLEEAVDAIIAQVGRDLHVATPLGLGKPNHFLNALYRRARRDGGLKLSIYTALTLARPTAESELEQRLMDPIMQRVFGNYPELDYESDRRQGALLDNVRVYEFFFSPGAYLKTDAAQRDYISTNYTYVARDLAARGVNVLLVQVAKGAEVDGDLELSLSCNADVARDLAALLPADGRSVRVCQTNGELPFMYGDAVLPADWFDIIVDNPQMDYTLYGPPSEAISDADALIGLYASTLIRDGGQLQIGIGSLGDALAYALRLRHKDNRRYREVLAALEVDARVHDLPARLGGLDPFQTGLFAATEMFADAYRHLWDAGLLSRRVYDDVTLQRLLNSEAITEDVSRDTLVELHAAHAVDTPMTAHDVAYLQRFGILRPEVAWEQGALRLPDGMQVAANLGSKETLDALAQQGIGDRLHGGCSVHAGFILGPQALYRWLHELPPEARRRLSMRSVSRINQLYGHEEIDRLQRTHGRFLNTAMMVTLSGAVVSDGLDDGRVVSGVGGQYNFVAMAHALPDGRSIIQLRATRTSGGELRSNIVANYGHTTVARHQRDLVVTEYGVAELRGKTDEEVIIALLGVADSRFQAELMAQAKASGKLSAGFELPEVHRRNLPEHAARTLSRLRHSGLFPRFPFGTDLTQVEQVLARALKQIQRKTRAPRDLLKLALNAVTDGQLTPDLMPYLERMALSSPRSPQDFAYQRLLVAEVRQILQDDS